MKGDAVDEFETLTGTITLSLLDKKPAFFNNLTAGKVK
jgi:hypothetical protein